MSSPASVPGSVRCGRQGIVDVHRSCASKQAYLGKDHAKALVRLMGARHREKFRLYQSDACRYWHVAHLVPAALRARAVTNWERPAVRVA